MFIRLTPKPKSSYNSQLDKVEYKQDRSSYIVLNSDHIVSVRKEEDTITSSLIRTVDGQSFRVNETVEVIYNMLNKTSKMSYQK